MHINTSFFLFTSPHTSQRRAKTINFSGDEKCTIENESFAEITQSPEQERSTFIVEIKDSSNAKNYFNGHSAVEWLQHVFTNPNTNLTAKRIRFFTHIRTETIEESRTKTMTVNKQYTLHSTSNDKEQLLLNYAYLVTLPEQVNLIRKAIEKYDTKTAVSLFLHAAQKLELLSPRDFLENSNLDAISFIAETSARYFDYEGRKAAEQMYELLVEKINIHEGTEAERAQKRNHVKNSYQQLISLCLQEATEESEQKAITYTKLCMQVESEDPENEVEIAQIFALYPIHHKKALKILEEGFERTKNPFFLNGAITLILSWGRNQDLDLALTHLDQLLALDNNNPDLLEARQKILSFQDARIEEEQNLQHPTPLNFSHGRRHHNFLLYPDHMDDDVLRTIATEASALQTRQLEILHHPNLYQRAIYELQMPLFQEPDLHHLIEPVPSVQENLAAHNRARVAPDASTRRITRPAALRNTIDGISRFTERVFHFFRGTH